jgi:ferrochelatase
VYWGNRNWRPLLEDTLRRMAGDGVRRALAFVTSAFSSYSGCRQYREDLERARAAVGAQAPDVEKLRAFHNHPGFIEANADRVRTALAAWPCAHRVSVPIAFTAHSIPLAMAAGCAYQAQLQEACALLAERIGGNPWALAFQSRSGAPGQPWLEPDIGEHLKRLHESGVREVVVSPLGFLSDHMEVVYDLDTEAAAIAQGLGMTMRRAAAAGSHPAIVAMIRELVLERVAGAEPRALGSRGPLPDVCPADCCLPGTAPARPGPRA